MTTQQFNRRVAAVKTADAINAIEGAPVSDYARMLSLSWAKRRDYWRTNEIRTNVFHRKMHHRYTKMADLYLYDDVPVLRNSLGIKDENTLDRIEAEQSRANMMLLYETRFS